MTIRHIGPEQLVAAGQALFGFYPRPSAEEIDDIIARVAKAVGAAYTTESNAKQLWRQRVGLTRATLTHVSPLRAALSRSNG